MSSSLKGICEDVTTGVSTSPNTTDCLEEESVESEVATYSEKLSPDTDEQILFNTGKNEPDDNDDSDSSTELESTLIKPRRFVQFSESLSDLEEEPELRASIALSVDAIVNNTLSKTNLFDPPDDISEFEYHPMARSKSESCIFNENLIQRIGHDTASGDDFDYFNLPDYQHPDVEISELYYEDLMDSPVSDYSCYFVRSSTSMPEILNGSRSRSKKLQRFSHTCSLPDLFFSQEM